MYILSIDPGHEQSAFVVYETDTGCVDNFGKWNNDVLLNNILSWATVPDMLVIEQIACMGMAVGAEVFETVFWSGRFCEAFNTRTEFRSNMPRRWARIKRHEVKMHLCGNMRAKDANIRQALIDRYGPGKDKAIGKKKSPGPLFGVSADVWSALAVAVTFADRSLVSDAREVR